MQEQPEFRNLLAALTADLQSVSIVWQTGVLAVCLLAAWLVRRMVRTRLMSIGPKDLDATVRISVGGLNRLVFPLTALALVYLGRWALEHFYPAHLLDLAIPLLFSFALVHTAVYLLRHAFAPSGLLRYWERAIAWGIWIGYALYVTGLLPELKALLAGLTLTLGKQKVSLLEILTGFLSVAVTVVIALWLGRLIEGRLHGAAGLDASMRAVASKLAKTLLVILAVLIALPLVGIDLTVLSVFGGALGVGIGLGLQKIAANYISGFIILIDRSVSPGALVTVDNRHGEVTRLTARYIVLKSMDGTEAIIPNETVVSSTVINHSYSNQVVRVDVPIQISYQSDVEVALDLMRTVAEAHPRAVKQPRPVALLKQFGESGIDLELYVWICDPESGTANLRSDLYLSLWKQFRAHRIDIPFPQREVRIVQGALPAAPPA
jgi:small-conductance mechanosensitive channel